MSVADFESSARRRRSRDRTVGLGVGRRIRRAIEATRAAVGHNTNLGIVLLASPFASALDRKHDDLRTRLGEVLDALTVEDARETYRAIRMAEPGGLGAATEHDVAAEPDVTLLEAMRAAERRDRIAWNYTHGYVGYFRTRARLAETGARALGRLALRRDPVYLGFLAHIPDTLIERKFGAEVAASVLEEARPIEAGLAECAAPEAMTAPLMAFDLALKERGLNPGTSADLTVATLFADALEALENPNKA